MGKKKEKRKKKGHAIYYGVWTATGLDQLSLSPLKMVEKDWLASTLARERLTGWMME